MVRALKNGRIQRRNDGRTLGFAAVFPGNEKVRFRSYWPGKRQRALPQRVVDNVVSACAVGRREPGKRCSRGRWTPEFQEFAMILASTRLRNDIHRAAGAGAILGRKTVVQNRH